MKSKIFFVFPVIACIIGILFLSFDDQSTNPKQLTASSKKNEMITDKTAVESGTQENSEANTETQGTEKEETTEKTGDNAELKVSDFPSVITADAGGVDLSLYDLNLQDMEESTKENIEDYDQFITVIKNFMYISGYLQEWKEIDSLNIMIEDITSNIKTYELYIPDENYFIDVDYHGDTKLYEIEL